MLDDDDVNEDDDDEDDDEDDDGDEAGMRGTPGGSWRDVGASRKI